MAKEESEKGRMRRGAEWEKEKTRKDETDTKWIHTVDGLELVHTNVYEESKREKVGFSPQLPTLKPPQATERGTW